MIPSMWSELEAIARLQPLTAFKALDKLAMARCAKKAPPAKRLIIKKNPDEDPTQRQAAESGGAEVGGTGGEAAMSERAADSSDSDGQKYASVAQRVGLSPFQKVTGVTSILAGLYGGNKVRQVLEPEKTAADKYQEKIRAAKRNAMISGGLVGAAGLGLILATHHGNANVFRRAGEVRARHAEVSKFVGDELKSSAEHVEKLKGLREAMDPHRKVAITPPKLDSSVPINKVDLEQRISSSAFKKPGHGKAAGVRAGNPILNMRRKSWKSHPPSKAMVKMRRRRSAKK